MKVVSFGGGTQSMSLMVLAAEGRLEVDAFLFANVGADSENPDTLRYVEEHARPYAAAHGLEFVELRRVMRDGSTRTLLDHLVTKSPRSVGIPVRMAGGGAPGRRQCTSDFKIQLVARWLRDRGATPVRPAEVGLGISMDELERARTPEDPRFPWTRRSYPLLDLKLYRDQCAEVILHAGLPVPPKSSCWFCPLKSLGQWQEMARRQPAQFQASAELEALLNVRRRQLGKDDVYFTSRLKPLPMAVQDDGQLDLGLEGCESGYCMT